MVLLVEDNTPIRRLIEAVLGNAGYSVCAAPNGRAGLEAMENGADLVLVDLELPDINGFELIKQLRVGHERVPIVAFSSHTGRDVEARIAEAGFDGYIPKPIDPTDFVERVEGFLRAS